MLIIDIILVALFAASMAYSGMKAGLTVAAGIPGSIIGSAFIAAFAKQKGILGKNLVQGMSSGGESVASGMMLSGGVVVTFIAGFIISDGSVLMAVTASILS